MPVYFFTFHAYRSWSEDDPRGYIQRGTPGIQKSNPKLAAHRDSSAGDPPVRFSEHQQHVLLDAMKDICGRRKWVLYAASVAPTHIHCLLSWIDESPVEPKRDRLKSLLGKALSDDVGTTGNRWFSRGQHMERVTNEKHLEELIVRYVPKHGLEGGLVYQKIWGNRKDDEHNE